MSTATEHTPRTLMDTTSYRVQVVPVDRESWTFVSPRFYYYDLTDAVKECRRQLDVGNSKARVVETVTTISEIFQIGEDQ